MKKCWKFFFSLLLVMSVMLFVSCDQDPTDDESVSNPTKTINNNIVLTKLAGETHAVQADKRIEVRFTAKNIPAEKAAEGGSLAIVGFYLCDSSETEYDWNNNDTSNGGDPTSSDFVDTVENGSVSYTFYYDSGNSNTDFKLFKDGTWDTAIDDPNSEDGNFKISFTDFAIAGDVVEVVLDASLAAQE